MSEKGTLVLEPVFPDDWWSVQRNVDAINAHQIGRGPAQARVFNSANISITNNTLTALTFDSKRWDTGNFHSTAANTSRLTAPTAGLYSIGACVRWAASAAGTRLAAIRLNGATIIDIEVIDVDSAISHAHNLHTEYRLAAGDYVEVVVQQDTGGALNVLTLGNQSPEFWIHRVGSQA